MLDFCNIQGFWELIWRHIIVKYNVMSWNHLVNGEHEHKSRNIDNRSADWQKCNIFWANSTSKLKIVVIQIPYILIINPLKLLRKFISWSRKIPKLCRIRLNLQFYYFCWKTLVPSLWRLTMTKWYGIFHIKYFSHKDLSLIFKTN